ncbi:MAG: ABC transporter permease [Planctomycetaceae bacterium]|nr:MAG: ABC transporter permease [Planctomycetaceae bacterium]
MSWVAIKMLVGDAVKFFGTVLGVTMGVLLIAQQSSIFVGVMKRTANPIREMPDAAVWVMDEDLMNSDEIRALSEQALYRVRGVPGVAWAVRSFKGMANLRREDGGYRQVILLGVDDHSLIGLPRRMVVGSWHDLQRPDAVILDRVGYERMFPGQPFQPGRELELNQRRAVLVGLCDMLPPFQSFPIVITRYSRVQLYVAKDRKHLSFVMAGPEAGISPEECARRIERSTGYKALSYAEFVWLNVGYYLANTGIAINFGITIALGFLVGTSIAGQTFYLFTVENLKQFGALKAMGVSNGRLVKMVLLQASLVGWLGYSLGMGLTALFFEITDRVLPDLRGMGIPWEVALGTALAVVFIICLASFISLRRVLRLEPAMVFR